MLHGGSKMLAKLKKRKADKLKRKLGVRSRITSQLVKDVEKYNPNTGESKMIYKPGKK